MLYMIEGDPEPVDLEQLGARRATDAEVLAVAATLVTKERYLVDPLVARFVDRINQVFATNTTSVLEQAATLDGAETVWSIGVSFDAPEGFDGLILAVPSRGWTIKPGRYLVIPLPDKETTDG